MPTVNLRDVFDAAQKSEEGIYIELPLNSAKTINTIREHLPADLYLEQIIPEALAADRDYIIICNQRVNKEQAIQKAKDHIEQTAYVRAAVETAMEAAYSGHPALITAIGAQISLEQITPFLRGGYQAVKIGDFVAIAVIDDDKKTIIEMMSKQAAQIKKMQPLWDQMRGKMGNSIVILPDEF